MRAIRSGFRSTGGDGGAGAGIVYERLPHICTHSEHAYDQHRYKEITGAGRSMAKQPSVIREAGRRPTTLSISRF